MDLAYFVYTLLLVIMVLSFSMINTYQAAKIKPIILGFSIILFSLVLGLRYDVGTDYLGYKEDFLAGNERFEVGYSLVCDLFRTIGFDYPSIFIFSVFIQFLFFYLGVKDNKRILPWAVFFYFTTLHLFLSLNVIRQTIAFSIFIYAVKFINNKSFPRYLLWCLIASTFHKSAIILIPFYLLNHINNDIKPYIYLLPYWAFFICGPFIKDMIWDNFDILAKLIGYQSYSTNINNLQEVNWNNENSLGLASYFWLVLNSLIIYKSKEITKISSLPGYKIYYLLFYFGLLVDKVVSGTYLERPFIYFVNIKIIVYAYFFYYIFSKQNKIVLKILSVLYVIIFIAFYYMAIHNHASQCSPFKFVTL